MKSSEEFEGYRSSDIYTPDLISNLDNSEQEYQIREFITYINTRSKKHLKKNEKITIPISIIESLIPLSFLVIDVNYYVKTVWDNRVYLKVLFQCNNYSYYLRILYFTQIAFKKIFAFFIDNRSKQEQLATGHKGTFFLNFKSAMPTSKNKCLKLLYNTAINTSVLGFVGAVFAGSLLPGISGSTFSIHNLFTKNAKKIDLSALGALAFMPELFGKSIFTIALVGYFGKYLHHLIHLEDLPIYSEERLLKRARKVMVYQLRHLIIENLKRSLSLYRLMSSDQRQSSLRFLSDMKDRSELGIKDVILLFKEIKDASLQVDFKKPYFDFNKKMIATTAFFTLTSTFAMLGESELDSGIDMLQGLSSISIFELPTFVAFLVITLLVNVKFSKDFTYYLFNVPRNISYFMRNKSGDFPVILQKNWKTSSTAGIISIFLSLFSFTLYHFLLVWHPIWPPLTNFNIGSLFLSFSVIPILTAISLKVVFNGLKYLLKYVPTSESDKLEIKAEKLISSILHYMKICKNDKLLKLISSLNEEQISQLLPLEKPVMQLIQGPYNRYGLTSDRDSLYSDSMQTLFSEGGEEMMNRAKTIQLIKKMYEQEKLGKNRESYDEERTPLMGRDSINRDSGREFARRSRCLVM